MQKLLTLIGSSGLIKILIAIENQRHTLITSFIPLRIKRRIGDTSYHIRIVMRVGYPANFLSGVNLLQRIEDGSWTAGFGIGICFYGELPSCRLDRLSAAEP
jgi:hypothetical protein